MLKMPVFTTYEYEINQFIWHKKSGAPETGAPLFDVNLQQRFLSKYYGVPPQINWLVIAVTATWVECNLDDLVAEIRLGAEIF